MVTLGAQRACSSSCRAVIQQPVDQRVNVVGAPRRLRQQRARSTSSRPVRRQSLVGQQGGEPPALLDRVLLRRRRRRGRRPERRPWVSGPPEPQHVDIFAGDRAHDVGSGDEDSALGRQDHHDRSRPARTPRRRPRSPARCEICGMLPDAWVIAWKIRPTRMQR